MHWAAQLARAISIFILLLGATVAIVHTVVRVVDNSGLTALALGGTAVTSAQAAAAAATTAAAATAAAAAAAAAVSRPGEALSIRAPCDPSKGHSCAPAQTGSRERPASGRQRPNRTRQQPVGAQPVPSQPGSIMASIPGLPGGSTTHIQCKVAGLVPSEKAQSQPLFNVLRGMCYQYDNYKVHEYGLKVPLEGGQVHTSLKMRMQAQQAAKTVPPTPAPPASWALIHEGTPMRGPAYNELPATVREVSSTSLYGKHALHFLHSLGIVVEYSITRDGNIYRCLHEGHEIEVQVMAIVTQGEPRTYFTRDSYLVEATTAAHPDKHAEAARALGSFSQRLLPMVQLRRE